VRVGSGERNGLRPQSRLSLDRKKKRRDAGSVKRTDQRKGESAITRKKALRPGTGHGFNIGVAEEREGTRDESVRCGDASEGRKKGTITPAGREKGSSLISSRT